MPAPYVYRMDFLLGLGVGILVTVIVASLGAFFFLRDTTPLPIIDIPPSPEQPSVTVMLIETLLNQQMRQVLANETLELQVETQQATRERVPFKIKLNEAMLDVKPGRRAKFVAQMTFSAWNLNLNIRPITDLYFSLTEGRIGIVVRKVQLRGFTVPRTLIDNFVNEVVVTSEARLNHSLEQLERETNVELMDIETTDDLMILKFRAKGSMALVVREVV